jgi:pyruvate formate lyase activating enzyme
MTRPPTSIATLQKARDIAKEVLSFVYVGNVPQMAESNTICPRCGHLLVRRDRGFVELGLAADGTCPQCGYDGL